MNDYEKEKYIKYSKINSKLGEWFKTGIESGVSVESLENELKQALIKIKLTAK